MSNHFIPLLFALIFALLIGPFIISFLKNKQFQQIINKNVPNHHLEKQGIPTLGGFIFLIPVATTPLFFLEPNHNLTFLLVFMFGFGMVGLIDDLLKIKCKRNLGLTIKQKLLFQLVISTLIFIFFQKSLETTIMIPNTNYAFHLDEFYFIFFLFISLATVNASNLTDGLDGLLSGVVIIALVPFCIIAYTLHKTQVVVFILICIGALLGFLFFNRNPAKIFMGDTGSFALGGLLVALSVMMKTELLLIIIGGVLVIEGLSVTIQLASIKVRKKPVFKMAPIHHTFELMGWKENKIVLTFWSLASIFAFVSMMFF